MFARKEDIRVCVLYGVTPLHAGSGQATGAVDLPIQRERHTGWPMVQASGVKGAFRDWFTRYYTANAPQGCVAANDDARELANKVFGREETNANDGHAGAVALTDARLLAFPVRSNVAPFVWVTCPALVTRLHQDLALAQSEIKVPKQLAVPPEQACVVLGEAPETVVLEDMAVQTLSTAPAGVSELATAMSKFAPQVTRLLLISNADFSFLVETATEVQPQIRIKEDTGTTQDGSLRYQELLPADSVLYCLAFFESERVDLGSRLAVDQIRQYLLDAVSDHIQLGGDMTLGRGIMQVHWLSATA